MDAWKARGPLKRSSWQVGCRAVDAQRQPPRKWRPPFYLRRGPQKRATNLGKSSRGQSLGQSSPARTRGGGIGGPSSAARHKKEAGGLLDEADEASPVFLGKSAFSLRELYHDRGGY